MSECICSISVDFDDYADMAWTQNRKAKKKYLCCECGKVIKPGETYEYTKMITRGEFDIYRTCSTCQEIRSCYFCSWLYTEMWKDLENELAWNGDLKLCMLDHLGQKARNVMIDFIDKLMEEDDE